MNMPSNERVLAFKIIKLNKVMLEFKDSTFSDVRNILGL